MPTLTRTVAQTKSTLKWLGILLSVLLLISILLEIIVVLKEHIAPTPPPPPTVTFGKLPPLVFPRSTTDKKLTYSLDTLTGLLPTLPDRAKVYKMVRNRPDFLALDKTQQKVSNIGFKSPGKPISQDSYQWTDNSSLSQTITFNIFSSDFTLSSSFMNDPAISKSSNFSNANSAIAAAQRFLFALSSFPDDIDLTKTKTLFYAIKDGELIPVASVFNAKIIRVDFFQKDIDNLHIYYPNPSTSTINLLVATRENREQIVGANFHHQSISDESATYLIKTASQAFDELKSQKAYIASYYGDDANISINNIFLGYYLGEKRQNYLMPVIIFESNNGFFAYVSAIKDEWISN